VQSWHVVGDTFARLGGGGWTRLARCIACHLARGEQNSHLLSFSFLSIYRQENTLSVSSYQFPSHLFANSEEFLTIVKKLFWSCNKNKTRFGYKRRGIMMAFPDLCGFYDEYFYNNNHLSKAVQNEDEMLLKTFENEQGGSMENLTAFDSLTDLFQLTQMTDKQFSKFKSEVLSYCKSNLVKIIVYLPSPYVTTFRTDEVFYML
jgi:hypothetical protein